MAPAASCNFNNHESGTFENVANPTGAGKPFQRKLEDFIEITEDEDFNNCRGEKKSQANAGAKNEEFDEAVDDEKSFEALDDRLFRKKQKPNKAQRAQMVGASGKSSLRSSVENVVKLSRTTQNSTTTILSTDSSLQSGAENAARPSQTLRNATTTSRPHHATFAADTVNTSSNSGNADSLRYHYIDRHREIYCHLCGRHFPNTFRCLIHMEGGHWSCSACRKMFAMPELYDNHCRTCYSARFGKGLPETSNGDGC